MKLFRKLLNILVAFVLLFLVSSWLEKSNHSWTDLGNYITEKGYLLGTKIVEDISQIDWRLK